MRCLHAGVFTTPSLIRTKNTSLSLSFQMIRPLLRTGSTSYRYLPCNAASHWFCHLRWPDALISFLSSPNSITPFPTCACSRLLPLIYLRIHFPLFPCEKAPTVRISSFVYPYICWL